MAAPIKVRSQCPQQALLITVTSLALLLPLRRRYRPSGPQEHADGATGYGTDIADGLCTGRALCRSTKLSLSVSQWP